MSEFAHDKVFPDEGSRLKKKEQVGKMFDQISGKYDFLNRFLSAGIDRTWRKKSILELKDIQPKIILDVATGTADMPLLTHSLLQPDKIVGIDISEGMLDVGRKKIDKRSLKEIITLYTGDAETINFAYDTFDAVTVAFGVRNFENLEKGLSEMLRVLKPGGKLVVLEFSRPKKKGFKAFYNLYMKVVAPGFGQLFAKNKEAYTYLNKSINAFPEREQFIAIMQRAGYRKTFYKTLSLGICCIYCGSK